MLLNDKQRELESSLKMYDNTLMEMRLKNEWSQKIDIIEKMRKEVVKELDCVKTAIKLQDKAISMGVTDDNHDKLAATEMKAYNNVAFEPLRNDMFIVTIKDIPHNQIVEIKEEEGFMNNWLTIRFRESVDFFSELYLDEHKDELDDFTIEVQYLDVTYNPVYIKQYFGCTLNNVIPAVLNYDEDKLLTTSVVFSYNTKSIKRNDSYASTN